MRKLAVAVALALVLVALGGCGSQAGSVGSASSASRGVPAAGFFHESGVARGAEELWIVARSGAGGDGSTARTFAPAQDERRLGLYAEDPRTGREEPLPLELVRADARLLGAMSAVELEQRFVNPYEVQIEAVYVFPLPADAAVHDFVMTIGERRIRGIVREREEARRLYEDARSQGHVASLLQEERPNVFTQKVANLEPGHAIEVELAYFHTLELADGWYEFVFPMTVGPRFNPPGSAGIGAVQRGASGSSGQPAEVPYLQPGARGHEVELTVAGDAGIAIEAIECRTHSLQIERPTPNRFVARLARSESAAGRDLVLRYRVGDEHLQAAAVTHEDERGSFVALTLHPPKHLSESSRAPIEMVFVVDASGSMDGEPLALAKSAVHRALDGLAPGDSLQIIRFSSDSDLFAPAPLAADSRSLAAAHRWVDDLRAGGGTWMIHGVRDALGPRPDAERRRIVAFLTDGYIGNESEILAAVKRDLGGARIFSFGIGSSPNRFLLEAMAREGRGAAAFVGEDPAASGVVEAFQRRIAHAPLAEIEIDWGGLAVEECYPRVVPDVFPGRPVTILGRLRAGTSLAGSREIEIRGRSGGGRELVRAAVQHRGDDEVGEDCGRALPWIWARAKIADLSSRALAGDATGAEILETALEFGLASEMTSFVAVDSSHRAPGEFGVTVPVPVRVPDGVRYETTVGGQ